MCGVCVCVCMYLIEYAKKNGCVFVIGVDVDLVDLIRIRITGIAG